MRSYTGVVMAPGRAGLEDVIAAKSAISDIIGAQGKLTYRGIDIHELAKHSSFEETVHLLWFGRLPAKAELQRFTDELASRRPLPEPVLQLMAGFPRDALPMDVLRTTLSALALYDPQARQANRESNLTTAVRTLAQTATIVGSWHQIRQGRWPLPPLRSGSHAEL